MHFHLRMLLGFTIGILATSGHAEDWRVASAEGSPYVKDLLMVDADTLKRDGGVIRFWIDRRYLKAAGSPKYNHVVERVEADCDDLRFATVQTTFYLRRDSIGTVGRQSAQYAPPGSVIANAITKVCAGDFSTPLDDGKKQDADEITENLFGKDWFATPTARKRKPAYKPYYPR